MSAQERLFRDPMPPGSIVARPGHTGVLYRLHAVEAGVAKVFGGKVTGSGSRRGWHDVPVDELQLASPAQRKRWEEIERVEAPLRAAIRPRGRRRG